ncbi:hypothetical protein PHET_04583, partial [Paragonimus heterotremus]
CILLISILNWLLLFVTHVCCFQLGPRHTQREQIMDKRSAAHNQSDVLYQKSLQGYYRNQGRRILHFHAERVVLHPNFQIRGAFHDIALIKVRGRIPIDGTYVAIANLPPGGNPNNFPEVGSTNYIVGFGCMYTGGKAINRANVLELRTNTRQECVSTYGSNVVRDITGFCAGYFHQNRGICSGDSGSGLISLRYGQPMVVGVASAAVRNDMSSFPGKFMRVAPYVSWIRQYVG